MSTDDYSAKPSSSSSASLTAVPAVPSDRADTTPAHAAQPYDVNRPTGANALTRVPTATPDTTGGSLGSRDTSGAATSATSTYGNTSVRSDMPKDTASPSTMNGSSSMNGVSPISASGSLPTCGVPADAKGAFMNDAQITHAVLIANSVDSAVSAGVAARTQNPAVRDFAQLMVRQHSDANQKLADIINRTRIAPAENDISSAILRDSTGHTFAVPVGVVVAHTVTPVTQPMHYDATMSAKPSRMDTVEAPPMGGTGSNPAVKNADTRVNVSDYNSPNTPSTTESTPSTPPASINATVTTPAPAATTATLSDDDKKFIDYMVTFHQQALDALDGRLIPFAYNAELRTALQAMRPVVQAHLDRAREIQRGQTASAY
ncbi:MAG TPA: DUF4142 domain-containing protein [Gemmatimonadales bacterium]